MSTRNEDNAFSEQYKICTGTQNQVDFEEQNIGSGYQYYCTRVHAYFESILLRGIVTWRKYFILRNLVSR